MAEERSEKQKQVSFVGIRTDILICFFLLLATVTLYSPAMDYGFSSYDDTVYITDNVRLHSGLTPENILWAFRTFRAANWHPVTWLSHMLDITLYGLNPGAHHAGNLLLHAANTLLLFFLLNRMTGRIWQSAAAAAFFALHPLHVESVVWIAERKDVLSAFFWLLTVWFYLRYTERLTRVRYFLVVVVFSLGLMAKPMLVTLPFVLLLLDFWPIGRFDCTGKLGGPELPEIRERMKRLILEKIPLLFLAAASSIVTIIAQKTGGALIELESISFASRVSNAVTSYVKYLYKVFWPFDLAIFYPYPEKLPFGLVFGACLLLLSITLIAMRNAGRLRWMAVGWLWFAGTLVPVIGLVQVGNQSMADRYMYIPSIGVCVLIAWGVPRLLERFRFKTVVTGGSAVLLLSIFFVNTGIQVRYWKDNLTLFRRAVEVTTGNLMAHIHLGAALEQEGERKQAIFQYRKGLQINPAYPKLHSYMAYALMSEGRIEDAVPHYREVLSMMPDDATTHNDLGLALLQQGKIEEAESHFGLALRANPGYRNARRNHVLSNRIRQKIDAAADRFQKALPKESGGRHEGFEMAELHERKAELSAALEHYRRALSKQPGFKAFRLNFDNIKSVAAAGQDYEKALMFFRKKTAVSSEGAEALYHLACIYARQNRIEKSLPALIGAVRSGFSDWKLINRDSDLKNIRGNPAFREFVKNDKAGLKADEGRIYGP